MKIKLLRNQDYTVWATVTRPNNSPFVHLQFDTEHPDKSGNMVYNKAAFETYLYPSELNRLIQLLSDPEWTNSTPTHRNQQNDEQIIPI
jgi:hypothetical protein